MGGQQNEHQHRPEYPAPEVVERGEIFFL